MSSLITGTIQDISLGTYARSIIFESYSDPSFDTGGTVTVKTKKDVTCSALGYFSVTLHPGTYRVCVNDPWKPSVWLILVPDDGLTYDISAIRVTTAPANATEYLTAEAVLALLDTLVMLSDVDPSGIPSARYWINTSTGTAWYASTDRTHWVSFG